MQSKRFLATISLCAVLTAVGCQSAPPAPAPEPTAAIKPTGKFADVATAISEAMRRWHYNPAELTSDGYRAMEAQVAALSETATSPEDFAKQFNAAWRKDGPFSHVRLDVARSSAADTAAYLDTMRVGGTGAKLGWRDDVAVLTVDTMMGADTIEQINAAYGEITGKQAKALVIDLRNNEGGAFAGTSLIGHVIDKPFDAGAFVSQAWARENSRPPAQADLKEVTPWTGESITAFWRDAQDNRLTRIQFQPIAPRFDGPVYVLVSNKTASAAEMTADAFKTSGRAILIGEKTEGAMLSQKMYDVPQGLQLSLPIADYYSVKSGRIEGVGVMPDIAVPAGEALEVATRKIAGG